MIDLDLERISLERRDLWPTRFVTARFPRAEELKSTFLAAALRRRRAGRAWGVAARAKVGLYESEPDLFEEPEMAPLVQFAGALLSVLHRKDVSFPESWCHVTNDGGYHDAHAHADFARHGASGIYYVDAGDCRLDPPNGVQRFYSPNVLEDDDVLDVLPIDGMLLLFPPHVRHAALPYRGERDRVVFSFNALLHAPEMEAP